VQLDQRPSRNKQLFSLSLTNKFLSAYSDHMRNDVQIQIHILKNLGLESGDQELAFDENIKVKNLVQVTFNPCIIQLLKSTS
jgi:hypothetical protein